jgi:hypothetical protein
MTVQKLKLEKIFRCGTTSSSGELKRCRLEGKTISKNELCDQMVKRCTLVVEDNSI